MFRTNESGPRISLKNAAELIDGLFLTTLFGNCDWVIMKDLRVLMLYSEPNPTGLSMDFGLSITSLLISRQQSPILIRRSRYFFIFNKLSMINDPRFTNDRDGQISTIFHCTYL